MKVESVFAEMVNGFERAVDANHGAAESFFTLAGRLVKMRVAGSELALQMVKPFMHLQTESEGRTPVLTIDLWDRRATGSSMPTIADQDKQNAHPASTDGRLTLHFHRQSILGLDRISERIVGCCTGADDLSLYESGRPLHAPLTVWQTDRDVPVIHAGLVSRNGVGVLLAGPGGSGKSTTAITCLSHGLNFLGDDMIGIEERSDASFLGHSIYNSTYLEPQHLNRFPQLKARAISSRHSAEDKRLVLLADLMPTGTKHSADIKVVVLPRLGSGLRSVYRPASRAKALMALGPSSRAINRGLGTRGFGKLVELVERTPCFWLELGSDLDGIPVAVMELLDEVE